MICVGMYGLDLIRVNIFTLSPLGLEGKKVKDIATECIAQIDIYLYSIICDCELKAYSYE